MRTLLIASLLVVIAAGCGSVHQSPPELEAPTVRVRTTTTRSAVAALASAERLTTSKVRLKLETEQPDSVHRQLIDLADRYEGQLLYSDLSKTTFRVPQDRLKDALTEVEAMGKLLEREIRGTDVTEGYKALNQQMVLLQRRKKWLLAEIDRMRDPDQLRALQSELDEVDAAIGRIELQQDAQAHEIYYALLNVTTTQDMKAGPIGWVLSNAVLGIKKLFVLN